MKPYYCDDRAGITLHLGDCRDILPLLPAESVDLILTDPPYGVAWESNQRQQSFGPIAGDHSPELAVEGIRLALRCLRDKRHVYAFGRYDLAGLPLTESAELIWDKGIFNGGDLESPWGNQHEYIQFVAKRRARTEREEGGRLAARLRRGSVLRYVRPSGQAVTLHPSEKPVDLLRELIESSSCIGETVLDPFAGVGSTLVAARIEGRSCIGIEIEERYAEIAANRLSQEVLTFA